MTHHPDCFSLLDQIPLGICVLRSDYQVVFWNRCLEEWTKISCDRIVGHSICEFFPHFSQSLYTHRLDPIFAGGPPTIFSSQLHKQIIPATLSQGQNRIQHTTVTAIPADGGGFYAMLSIQDVTDLTSRVQSYRQMRDQAVADAEEIKRSAVALRESEERLQMALDGSEGGLWDWSIATGDYYMSPRWLEMLGYEKEDLPEKLNTWEQLIHPDDKLWVMAQLQAHLQNDLLPYKFEYRLLTRSGAWKWIANYGKVVMRDTQGRPLRMAGIHHDISDRKQIEAALEQREEQFRFITNTIPQIVWTTDPYGVTDYVNQRWTDYTGLSIEGALQNEWQHLIHPEDLPAVQAFWTEACKTAGVYEIEYRLRRFDGEFRWHLVKGLPMRDSQGQVIKWFGTCTDIHDQKELELERLHLLKREQAARAEAERANRIKDDFLAVLSHELRSPLNPILGWTKLLQTGKFDPIKTAEALATIERNARLQTQLIDDLLDIAKILRGKLNIEMVPVDLRFVIESAIDTVKATAAAKSILLHSVLPPVGQVAGDTARLQQIVWNLLSNAIKFTPAGGRVEVELSVITEPASSLSPLSLVTTRSSAVNGHLLTADYAQITVRDTGKGIKSEFLPHIFESFQQEDISITRKYGGLGLGLAIVCHLVEAHGGTIWADSPGEGLGATFTVRFPLLAPVPERNPSREGSTYRLDLSGIRVLTVDDEPDARNLLTALLTQYGAEVFMVTSAAEVLANLELWQPHVLISDIGMPEVDGYSLIKQVRSLAAEKGGQIPAIALTAYAREDDHRQAITSGYQWHVTKPLEPEQLVQAVMTVLGRN